MENNYITVRGRLNKVQLENGERWYLTYNGNKKYVHSREVEYHVTQYDKILDPIISSEFDNISIEIPHTEQSAAIGNFNEYKVAYI